jgi:VanZ family protein
LFLVLGSLTPFQIDVESLRVLLAGGDLSFWSKCNVGDACVNLLIYVPLGASLFALMRGRFETGVASVLTLICGAGLSVGLELGQLILKGRYASWWDVLFNSAGTLIGAQLMSMLARSIVRRMLTLRRSFQDAPSTTTEAVVVFVMLVMSVVPFDFVTTARGLQTAMRESQIPVAAAAVLGRPMLAQGSASQTWADLAAGDLGWSVAFAVLGYLFVARNRREGSGLCDSIIRSLGSGFLLAMVLEVLQLFASGHVFSLPDIAVHAAGVLVGVTLATLRECWLNRRSRGEQPSVFCNELLACIALGQALVILLPSYLGLVRADGGRGFSPTDWIPFPDLLAMPFASAASELMDAWCVYALMVVPAFVWWMRLAPRWATMLSIGLAMAVAVVAGMPGSGQGATGFSTQVLAAFIAAYGTIRLTRFFMEDAVLVPRKASASSNSFADGISQVPSIS